MLRRRVSGALALLLLICVSSACLGSTRMPRGSADALVGTTWAVTELDGDRLIDDTEVTMVFREGYLSGAMTCNSYGGGPDSGPYIAKDNGRFRVRQLAVTVQLCESPAGVMAQEARITDLLLGARHFRVDDDQLLLFDAGRACHITFRRVDNR